MQQQGAQANANGRMLESDIAHRLSAHGYTKLAIIPDVWTLPFFVQQSIGTPIKPFINLYALAWKVDFFLWHPQKHANGLIIESRYQGIGGSVDEKYPFLIGSLKQQPCDSLLLILGTGARPKAVEWCRKQSTTACRIMTWEEFVAYANKG